MSSEPSTAARIRHRIGAHLRRRAECYWVPALYAIALALLYWPILGGTQGYGWDTIETYWPDLVYFSDQLSQGQWSLWNPFDRGGFPVAADPQPGMYYPLHWLLSLWGIATGEVSWWLIQLKMLGHHLIAAVCLYAFLRHRKLDRAAAFLGGIALIASTPWLIHKASNLLMPMAWTPLIWILTDRLLDKPTLRRAVFLAGGVYLAGSAGSPPGFFYTLVMGVAYGAYRGVFALIESYRSGDLKGYLLRLLPLLIVAALLSVGLLWVSVAPGLELSEFTPRATRNLSYALSLPLPPAPTLKALIAPNAGQVDAYLGVLTTLLALCAVIMRPRQDGGAPIFFFVGAVFFLMLSFGKDTPFLTFLVEHVPGFGLFRISSRYKCLFAPFMAVLAAYGASNLLRESPRLGRESLGALVLGLAFLAAVLILVHDNPLLVERAKRFPGAKTPIVLTLLSLGMLWSAVVHGPRGARLLVWAMPLLMLWDPDLYWHHKSKVLEKRPDHLEDRGKLAGLEDIESYEYRIYDEYLLEQRPGSRLGVRDFRGYPSGDPLDFKRYQDVLKALKKHPQLIEAFNVKYLLHGPHHRNGKRTNRIKKDPSLGGAPHFRRMDRTIAKGRAREAMHPVPLIAWYGAVQIVDTNKAIDALAASEGPGGERRWAIVERGDVAKSKRRSELEGLDQRRSDAPLSRGGRLVSYEADRVVVEIEAPAAGIAVLNEVHYPGWSVRVDGQPADALRSNYLLRAVLVGPGPHRIEWSYLPTGHGLRSTMYLLCFVVLLLALVWRESWTAFFTSRLPTSRLKSS